MAIKVDQTLHGYANGHSLLQSSIRLSSELERLMLGLSDMSGPGMRPGFDSYLTAYPLVTEQAYVIARTWYAIEMQRPGCVWTHSLLIRNADIRRIRDGRSLARLFQRPASLTPGNSYTAQLTLEQEAENWLPASQPTPTPDEFLLRTTLWSLYRRPDKSVYVIAPNAREQESMILQLWSQQWPQLREAFSFCTGALSNRMLRGKSFNLQVVPKDAFSELRHELAKGVVVDATLPVETFDTRDLVWMDEAIRDLTAGSAHRVREIAWSLAEGRVADRASFPAVFHLAAIVQQQRTQHLSADDYVRAVTMLPTTIKVPMSLFKPLLEAAESSGVSALSEHDLLRALATVPIGDIVQTDDLDIDGRVNRLWQTNKRAALDLFSELIAHENATEVASQVLLGMCRALQPEDLESITQNQPVILNVLIERNPLLAASPTIWRAHQNEQVEIFHTLMSAPLDELTMKQVVGAILLSGSENVVDQVSRYGDRLIAPILEWLNSDSPDSYNLPKSWARYLRSQTDTAVAWLRTHIPISRVLILLASALPADSSPVASVELRVWVPLLQSLAHLSESDAIPVAAFLFALGLRHCEPPSMEFTRDSFVIVHDAAARNNLDHEYWRPIAAKAPPLTWWRDWDKCERMRAAFLDRFMTCSWPSEELLAAVRNANTLSQLFGLSKTTKGRKRFLQQTAEIGLRTDISSDCRRVLEDYT